MSTRETAALRSIADELMEARRYVRTHPDHACGATLEAAERLMAIRESIDVKPMDPDRAIARIDGCVRVRDNLCDGLAAIHHDPLILEGHLYAAARLLQSIAGRLEKGADA